MTGVQTCALPIFWEVVGGTGKFKGLQGAGTLHIGPAGATDRRFSLDGELVSVFEDARK